MWLASALKECSLRLHCELAMALRRNRYRENLRELRHYTCYAIGMGGRKRNPAGYFLREEFEKREPLGRLQRGKNLDFKQNMRELFPCSWGRISTNFRRIRRDDQGQTFTAHGNRGRADVAVDVAKRQLPKVGFPTPGAASGLSAGFVARIHRFFAICQDQSSH